MQKTTPPRNRKLGLHKESLRRLTRRALEGVAGGSYLKNTNNSCWGDGACDTTSKPE